MILDGLLRGATLRLARPGGPAALVRPRVRALRAALGGLLLRRGLPGALEALSAGGARAADGEAVLEALSGMPMSCLWRALAGYAALRQRGTPVRFVLGVRTTDGEPVAHAWVELDGAPLAQRVDPRGRFPVAFTFPPPEMAPGLCQEHPMSTPPLSPDVILTELDDGTGVLLDLGTKFYFALNRTGVAVWKLLGEGVVDPVELARALAARFEGVAEAQALADVTALLEELRAEGLAGPG